MIRMMLIFLNKISILFNIFKVNIYDKITLFEGPLDSFLYKKFSWIIINK